VSCVKNIAAYLFVKLDRLEELRESILRRLQDLSVVGTVLIATEGINLFLAGAPAQIDAFMAWLRQDARFAEIKDKQSLSSQLPFRRLLVKIKREIVPLGEHNLDPNDHPAPYLTPLELKEWIDQGRDFVLLDTRNRFEFKMGTFSGAEDLSIGDFRSFPAAIAGRLEEWKDRPVVTFCTGGIRCEKAAPLMLKLGFNEVYQLDGGILKYLEAQAGVHFHGECFVFDDRVALDEALQARA